MFLRGMEYGLASFMVSGDGVPAAQMSPSGIWLLES
jgi:hypothetical protein